MTQEAIVTKRLPNGMAEVVVTRSTACGSNCGNCESCIFQNELKTLARNTIDVAPGQRVLIESNSSKVYKAILWVYILPIVLLLAGFIIPYCCGLGQGLCILFSFLGLLLGGAAMVLVQRRKMKNDPITFEIIERI